MNTSMVIKAYCIYLPVVIGLTWYVSNSLFMNGKFFMHDIFKGKIDIASATNRLFKVGFYLLNIGFAFLIMRISDSQHDPFDTSRELIEILSSKLGGFSIYLGITLFLHLFLFMRGRRKAMSKQN